MSLYYLKAKDQSLIQCTTCGRFKFKIEITKGSHQRGTTYMITCNRCNEDLALNYSKVKEISFPFIQCPTCGKFKFKIKIIKKSEAGYVRTNTLNMKTQKLYEKNE